MNALSGRLAGIYETSANPHRMLSMEGVRGLAIVLVFFVHYHSLFSFYLDPRSWTYRVSLFSAGAGHAGVDLFFVISGYLIYGVVMHNPKGYMRFIRRRIERIYPTFITVLVLQLILSVVFPEKSRVPTQCLAAVEYVLMNAALLPGILRIKAIITVAWSLSYELFFYLTIPLLVRFLRMPAWSSWQRVLLFVSVIAIRCSLISVLPIRMLMFLAGILVFEMLRSSWVRSKLNAGSEMVTIGLFIVSLLPVATLTLRQAEYALYYGSYNRAATLRVLILSVTMSLFTIHCIGFKGMLNTVLSWAPLRWLGNMSYSYYLIHGLTLQGVHFLMIRIVPPHDHSPVSFWCLLPISVLATLVTSTALFVAVEKPFSLQQKGVRTVETSDLPKASALEPQGLSVGQGVVAQAHIN
jgi:exopolysaccharide production protein ExoZ